MQSKEYPEFMDSVSQLMLVHRQMNREKGEDAYAMAFNIYGGLLGVFDGCGGAGARKYPQWNNLTGAYIASRLAAHATEKWFTGLCFKKAVAQEKKPHKGRNRNDTANLLSDIDIASETKLKIDKYLKKCTGEMGVRSVMKGDIAKDFPTTAAFAVIAPRENVLLTSFCWCGDSRGYILDQQGLHQVTRDDLENTDALYNLKADGKMNNLISASAPYEIHRKDVCIEKPCLIFTATDGCFGYFASPMEFEYILLDTLSKSSSVEEWEAQIEQVIGNVTGDDFTFCAALVFFEDFSKVRLFFENRRQEMENYRIQSYGADSSNATDALWKKYKKHYEYFKAEHEKA